MLNFLFMTRLLPAFAGDNLVIFILTFHNSNLTGANQIIVVWQEFRLAGTPQVFGRNLGVPLRPKSGPLPSPKRGNQGRKAGPKGEAVLPLRELEGLRKCILNLPNTYGGDAKPGALVVGVPANHLYSETSLPILPFLFYKKIYGII
jgi:hypothetical protein